MKDVVDIGSRRELFVDDFLIEQMNDAHLRLHSPEKREVVLTVEKPWEDTAMAYFTILRDGPTVRMYYRGICGSDDDEGQTACMAESIDGIQFERPNLGIVDFDGSKDNNIILQSKDAHNFTPFIDRNPDCKEEERYKALGGHWKELSGFVSPDGVHWKKIQDEPLDMKGSFDSQNLAFWDSLTGCYRAFVRDFAPFSDGEGNCRIIQTATSDDFVHWSEPTQFVYGEDVPLEQFYTNATIQCPGAEHILVSFPKRFVPERTKIADHGEDGVSDAVFMSSRDGVHWDRSFMEAWVRPGLDQRNWTERSSMTAWGIIENSPTEWSMYISEHYRWETSRLRRLAIRPHGFASVNAGYGGGEFTTRPIVFSGSTLRLNYSTSAPGSVQVEVQDEAGKPIEGFSDMEPLYGDELDAAIVWPNGDLGSLAGKPVRFRFTLRDADVFAISLL